MKIVVKLDEMLARRKKRSKELAEFVGITKQNILLIKTGRVKGMRFNTLEKMCEFPECQPGDLLEFIPDNK